MTTLHRMHTPSYVDVKSLTLCFSFWVFKWLNGKFLSIHLGSVDFKVILEVAGVLATFTTVVYNALKTYKEVIEMIVKYKTKKKEKREREKFLPPSDDQFD